MVLLFFFYFLIIIQTYAFTKVQTAAVVVTLMLAFALAGRHSLKFIYPVWGHGCLIQAAVGKSGFFFMEIPCFC